MIIKIVGKILIVFFIILSYTSCVKNNNTATYTIKGRLVDGTNLNNKFSFLKLKFQNEYNHNDIKILGETMTDANGNFNLTYEFSKDYHLNFMRIIVDSFFIASNKLRSIEIGSNWNKIFYLGDSALFDLYVDKAIGENDTLYFSNWDSTYTLIGPHSEGLIKRFKCLNYNQYGLLGYGIGKNNYINSQKIINFMPTGEPIVDELHLKLTD